MKTINRSILLWHLMVLLFFLQWCQIKAQTQEADSLASSVEINPTHDPNFVRIYIICATPGTKMTETWGHAAMRLICDEHQLDYAYTFVRTNENPFNTLAGKCKSATKAFTFDEYIARYQVQGRGVKSYELQLPIELKQRLWQQMDERLEKRPRRLDQFRHGCAQSVFQWVTGVIDRDSLQLGAWDTKFDNNIKEILGDGIEDSWLKMALDGLFGGSILTTTDLTHKERVIVPNDLVQVLQQGTAYGKPLLSTDATELLPLTRPEQHNIPHLPTYCMIGWLMLMIGMIWRPCRPVLLLALSIVFLLGLVLMFMVFISTLPGTEWNWLLLPVNPLPLLCWRWRRYWALPFACLCLVWVIVMLLVPHIVVYLPWIIFVAGVACASFALKRLQ